MAFLHKDLFLLRRGFLALVPPSALQFPKEIPLTTIHDFFLNNILLDPHVQSYPPSSQYQKLFWKWAITHLEDLPQSEEDPEIDSQIYDHYVSLLQLLDSESQSYQQSLSMRNTPPTQSYITHYWKPFVCTDDDIPDATEVNLEDYHTVTLLESRTTIESGTTGLRTWMASFVLAQYLTLHPDLISSRRVLELGSGIGFLGIIIASLQQLSNGELPDNSLWLTDGNAEVLARCKDNVSLPCNTLSALATPNYRNLDWSAALDENQVSRITSLLNEDIDADLIVGADIVFDPSLIPALVAVLKIALQPTGKPKTALIALTLRNEHTISHFMEEISSASVNVADIPVGFERSEFIESIEGPAGHQTVKLFQITI